MILKDIYMISGYYNDTRTYIPDNDFVSYIAEAQKDKNSLGFYYFNLYTKNLKNNEIKENFLRILDILPVCISGKTATINYDTDEYKMCEESFYNNIC